MKNRKKISLKNLFVYGALRYEEVWRRIVIGNHQKVSAQLPGYRRLRVRDEEYPGMVKGGGTVKGLVWRNVEEDNISRLDTFEGEYYTRKEEVVQDMTGQDIKADVYIIREECKSILGDVEWDQKHFETVGLRKSTRNYAGFNRIP